MSTLSAFETERRSARITPLPGKQSRSLPRFGMPVLVLLGWIVAALGVYGIEFVSRGPLAALPRTVVALACIGFILATGAIFARAARGATIDSFLAIGLGWLLFSIAADVVTGIRSPHPAYQLLGDPSVIPGWLRDATTIVWLISPTLAARRSEPGAASPSRWDSFPRTRP